MKVLAAFLFLSVLCQNQSPMIFDFKIANSLAEWYILYDGLMGGLSQVK